VVSVQQRHQNIGERGRNLHHQPHVLSLRQESRGSVKQKIIVITGTRPDIIKTAPVVAEMRLRGAEITVIHTNQHPLRFASPKAVADLGDGIIELAPAAGVTLERWIESTKAALASLYRELKPAAVLVQGDVASALAGAQAANAYGAPLIHLEAGVRSGCLTDPAPEEAIRIEIDRLSDLLLAPTEYAANNLDYLDNNWTVDVTGSTTVSALARYTDAHPGPESGPTIFVTLHRGELQERNAAEVIGELWQIARDLPRIHFFWPVHPTMEKFIPTHLPPNMVLTGPLDHADVAQRISTARGVLTDSGGVSEEAATLGVPAVHLRFHTDRPEAIHWGIAERHDPTPQGVSDAVEVLATRSIYREPCPVFGTPTAASQAAAAVCNFAEDQ
jgi:UDP-N-acetylglucosamine 2-epimerase (non-hydrolysing)